MVFVLIIVAIAICVTAVLLAATRIGAGDSSTWDEVESDIAVYKDQLAEIDRDLTRGVLSESDAEQVRLEVSRRLLEADKRERDGISRLSAGAGLAFAIVPVVVLL